MKMWSQEDLAEIVSNETQMMTNHLQLETQYSSASIPCIKRHKEEIKTDFDTNENLTSNFVRYRLKLFSNNQQKDWYPRILGEHRGLMTFVRSIFTFFYFNSCFVLNLSPVLLLETTGDDVSPDIRLEFIFRSFFRF